MGTILKWNRYRLVDNHAFDMPLPLKFEIRKKDCAVAEYEISEDEKISCRILTKYKEDMLTTIRRPLTISDIYYLFSCRVFQDRTPFTMFELALLGMEKYNVYNILKKTRGITPFDEYWIRFDGDECTYDKALEEFNAITAPVLDAITAAPADIPGEPEPAEQMPEQIADLKEVLSQHTVDVSRLIPEPAPKPSANSTVIMPDAPQEEETLVNNKMTEDEIEELLRSAGLSEDAEPAPAEPSGGMMSQDDIAALFAANAAEPAPAEPSGGKMSQDDIAALFASNVAEPAPAEPSGGKMSQDDIAALFAANAAEPAPAEPSGGKMSQDDIAALFAANAAEQSTPTEPAPADPSGGKMSQDDIAALFAANAAEPAPAEPSGGKMSQDDIAALFAANAAEPAPAEPSGGKMSQDDIEALLKSMQDEANK